MMILSMDLGKFNTVCCFYDTANHKYRFETIQTRRNHVEHIFGLEKVEIDTGKRAWCLGRERIDSFRESITDCGADELWKGELDLELMQLDDLTEKMKAVEDRLEQFAKANPNIQRVMTIPGVGRKTAETLVAAIDDPHRFKNARHLSSYLGMTPKQYQSGETDRSGRISKRGPRLLRTMLLECAWASTRYNAWRTNCRRTAFPLTRWTSRNDSVIVRRTASL